MMRKLTAVLYIRCSNDEEQLLTVLKNSHSIEVLEVIEDQIKFIEILNSQNPDVLFLSVEYESMMTYIKKPPFIIGVSNLVHEQKRELINKDFFDFVLLPVNDNNFFTVISKLCIIANTYIYSKEDPSASEENIRYVSTPTVTKPNDYIFVKHNKSSIKILHDDIKFISNMGNLLKVETVDGNTYYHHSTLKKFCEKLPEDKFLRINKSTIINHTKIQKYHHQMVWINNEIFKVSRIYDTRLRTTLMIG